MSRYRSLTSVSQASAVSLFIAAGVLTRDLDGPGLPVAPSIGQAPASGGRAAKYSRTRSRSASLTSAAGTHG